MRQLVKNELSGARPKGQYSGTNALSPDAFELVTDILAELVLEDIQQHSRMAHNVSDRVGGMEESSPYPHRGHA